MISTENCYRSVDLTVRNEISCGLAARLDQAQIARLVGFSPCLIRPEVWRHHVAEIGYRAYWA